MVDADLTGEEDVTKEVGITEEEKERWIGAVVSGVSMGSPGRIGKLAEGVATEEERDTVDGTALDSEMTENAEDIDCPLELTGKEVEAADVIA